MFQRAGCMDLPKRRRAMSQTEKRANHRVGPRRVPKGGSRAAGRRGALGLGPNIVLKLLDISETGARLLVKEPLKVGQEVEVSLSAPAGFREVKVLARVVWGLATADGAYCVGVQFEKRLAYAALQDLSRLPGI